MTRTQALWSLSGALIAFGFLTGFSIGLPFFAAGVVLLLVLVARGGSGAGMPLLLGGMGAVLLAIGALNLGSGLGTVLLVLGTAMLAAGRIGCHRSGVA